MFNLERAKNCPTIFRALMNLWQFSIKPILILKKGGCQEGEGKEG